MPKPGKKWRPVIDLSVLSNHLTVPTFKMETAEVIRNSICKGEWIVSVDLTDAYFHVPIHQRSQNLLRFHVGGRSFQFRALPFGIATAPLRFTHIVKEVKLMLQNKGIQIHQYLDEWLLRAPSQPICRDQTKQLVAFVQELGWVINFKKSGLTANSKIGFPRVQVRPKEGRSLTNRKEMAHFDNSHIRSKQQFDNNSQNPDVIYRHSGISGENSPNGQVAYETLPMVLENPLEVPPIVGQQDTMFRNLEKTSGMVEKSKKCPDGLSPTCRGTQSPTVHRCIDQGLECTFGRPDSQ